MLERAEKLSLFVMLYSYLRSIHVLLCRRLWAYPDGMELVAFMKLTFKTGNYTGKQRVRS